MQVNKKVVKRKASHVRQELKVIEEPLRAAFLL